MIYSLEDLSEKDKEQAEFIQKLIVLASSQSKALAAHVVLYKSLGLFKLTAIACMAELSRRRHLGDDFQYEIFIEEELGKIPKVHQLDINSIKNILDIKQLSSLIKKN
jgi:hypothetical protein